LEKPTQAKEKKVLLISNCPDDYINADINMVTTILRNLIANAIKFSHPGSEIIISAEKESDKSFKFQVQDHGIGIAENDIPKLFDITSHHSMPGTNNEKGSGLGLILCKEFVLL